MSRFANVVLLVGLSMACSFCLSACDSGGSSSGSANAGVAAGTAGSAGLSAVTPGYAQAGDVVVLAGDDFSIEPSDNRVFFRADHSDVVVEGSVLEARITGTAVPNLGTPMELQVMVPTGVRTGTVEVQVFDDESLVSTTSTLAFEGAPVVVGYLVGRDAGLGTLGIRDANLEPIPGTIEVYGYNLDGVDEATFVDYFGLDYDADSVTYGLPDTATYEMPDGLEAVSIEVPAGMIFFCEQEPVPVTLGAMNGSGERVTSNPFEIAIHRFEAFGPDGENHGIVTGAVIPCGVRSGEIPIHHALFSNPANSRWNVIPEYLDPETGEYVECTPVPVSFENGIRELPGGLVHKSSQAAFVGPGNINLFRWDSKADLDGERGVTRLRLAATDPFNSNFANFCVTPYWETEWIAFDNTGEATEGAIIEGFESQANLDFDATDAMWPGDGRLEGASDQEVLPGGDGTEDFVIGTGDGYIFDTDRGVIIDIFNIGAPELDLDNPGADLDPPEFHFATLEIQDSVTVDVIGDHPLVIRCAGDGDPDTVAFIFHGTIDVSGSDGASGVLATPGAGGEGVAGGGDGGTAGVVDTNGQNAPGEVILWSDSSDGGNDGGGAGANISVLKPYPDLSSPRSGPAGGGGHGSAGLAGTIAGSSTLIKSRPGIGGMVRGDDRLTVLTSGSGGGGGGGCPVRFDDDPDEPTAGVAGGGGGAGGGSIDIRVDGSAEIGGRLVADGGEGKRGHAVGGASPGGGGSGGGIAIRTTGDITLEDAALIRAVGGIGGRAGSVQVAGHGGRGRVVLEAEGDINVAEVVNLSQLVPPLSSAQTSIGPLVDPIDAGDGSDGNLDLRDQAGIVFIDTDTGIVENEDGEELLTGAEGTGEFFFDELHIPDGVTVSASGDNPLLLRVSGNAVLHGTIDVSGRAGGEPDLGDPDDPGMAAGGPGGPGGGRGGAGGALGDDEVEPEYGGLPLLLPDELNGSTGDPDDLVPGAALPATAGSNRFGGNAGSGGGGGHGDDGGDADDLTGADSGEGGTKYGNLFFKYAGADLFVGGGGGGGGGAHESHGGEITFGSAGGGGGGFVLLEVEGLLVVGATGRILALGGDTIDSGGSSGDGGAGAGGGIYIRVARSPRFLADSDTGRGPLISVAGGTPSTGDNGGSFTTGGSGAAGRIRIEGLNDYTTAETASECEDVYTDSLPPEVGLCPVPVYGRYDTGHALVSRATSRAYPITIGSGVRVARVEFATPEVEYAELPTGTQARILFEGARESLDAPGTPGQFFGRVADPNQLGDVDYVRFIIYLYGDPETGDVPVIEKVRLGYEVE